MAKARSCPCGYRSEDRSNFRRHGKRCPRAWRTSCAFFAAAAVEAHDARQAREPDDRERVDELVAFGTEQLGAVPRSVVEGFVSHYDARDAIARFVECKHFLAPRRARNIVVPTPSAAVVRVVARDLRGRARWTHLDRRDAAESLLTRAAREIVERYTDACAGARGFATWAQHLREPSGMPADAWDDQVARVDHVLSLYADRSAEESDAR